MHKHQYTWIIAQGEIDPLNTITADEFAAWVEIVTEYVEGNEPDNTDVRVIVATGNDAAGTFRGHYPDTCGPLDLTERDTPDWAVYECINDAFAWAWKCITVSSRTDGA